MLSIYEVDSFIELVEGDVLETQVQQMDRDVEAVGVQHSERLEKFAGDFDLSVADALTCVNAI